MKAWLARIRCESLPINVHTRICSDHFEGNKKQNRYDVPSIFARTKTNTPRSSRNSNKTVENEQSLPSSTSGGARCTSPVEISNEKLVVLAEAALLNESNDNLFLLAETAVQSPQVDSGLSGLSLLSQACDLRQHETTEKFDKECQTDITFQQLDTDRCEIDNLKTQINTANLKQVNVENVKKDISKLKFFTGFTRTELFDICFNFITYKQITSHANSVLDLENEFLLVIMRLRLGLSKQLLAYIFSINVSTVSRIFLYWMPLMYRRLKLINIWPSKDQVINKMPLSVAVKYPSLRVIIDCTEIKIPKPKGPVNQQVTFSSYKNCNTAKVLVGISPSGAISFVSDLYGGNISYKEITKRCGILEKMDAGDSVLADRGFLIEDIAKPYDIRVNIPPFTSEGKQLEPYEVVDGRRIANTRIHREGNWPDQRVQNS